MEQPPAKATASGLVQSLVWMPELSQGVAVAQGCLGGCSALKWLATPRKRVWFLRALVLPLPVTAD